MGEVVLHSMSGPPHAPRHLHSKKNTHTQKQPHVSDIKTSPRTNTEWWGINEIHILVPYVQQTRGTASHTHLWLRVVPLDLEPSCTECRNVREGLECCNGCDAILMLDPNVLQSKLRGVGATNKTTVTITEILHILHQHNPETGNVVTAPLKNLVPNHRRCLMWVQYTPLFDIFRVKYGHCCRWKVNSLPYLPTSTSLSLEHPRSPEGAPIQTVTPSTSILRSYPMQVLSSNLPSVNSVRGTS